MKTIRVISFWILAAGLIAAVATAYFLAGGTAQIRDGLSVTLQVDGLAEASGLAASRRAAELFYSLNDSGNTPVLFAFDAQGRERGRVRIRGVKNQDWEALAAVMLDGQSYLFVGDIGDNAGRRRDTAIHVIEEPDPSALKPGQETAADLAWSVPFRYADGPHDCETMLVDARRREILLISKRTLPQVIYRLPFRGKPGEYPVATPVGRLVGLPQPSSFQRLFPSARGRYRGQPTDGAISDDDATAAILTYGCVVLYRREPGEAWEKVLGRNPARILEHDVPVSEALTFSPDGKRLDVTGEGRHSTLLEFPVPRD